MRPSWQRVEQRQRKEVPLETVICMLIWPQASLPSGTMRHSCVVTRLHRDVHITLPLQQQRRGICLLRRTLFWIKTLWMVVSWKWHSAPMMNLERTRTGKSWKRLNFRTTTGQMSSHRMTQSWKINLALWKRQRPMQ